MKLPDVAVVAERIRVRLAQAPALRSLRSELAVTPCLREQFDGNEFPGCGKGDKRRTKHAEDCGYGNLLEDIRTLEKATR